MAYNGNNAQGFPAFPAEPGPQPDQILPPEAPEGNRILNVATGMLQAIRRLRDRNSDHYSAPDIPMFEDLGRIEVNIEYLDPMERDERGLITGAATIPPDVRIFDTESSDDGVKRQIALQREELQSGEVPSTGMQRFFERRWRLYPLPSMGSILRQRAEMRRTVMGEAFDDTMHALLYQRAEYVEKVAQVTPKPISWKWRREMRRIEREEEQNEDDAIDGDNGADRIESTPQESEVPSADDGNAEPIDVTNIIAAVAEANEGGLDAITPATEADSEEVTATAETTELPTIMDTEWPAILQFPERPDNFKGLPEPNSIKFLREFANLSLGGKPDKKSLYAWAFAHLRNYGDKGNNLVALATDPLRVRGIRQRFDIQKPIYNYYRKLIEQDQQEFGQEWLENYFKMFPTPTPPATELTKEQIDIAKRNKDVFTKTDGEYFLDGLEAYNERREDLADTIDEGVEKVKDFIFHPHPEITRRRYGHRSTVRPGPISLRRLPSAYVASISGQQQPAIFKLREPRRQGEPETFDEPGGVDFCLQLDVTASTGSISDIITNTGIVAAEINDGCNGVIVDAQLEGKLPQGDHQNSMAVGGFGYRWEDQGYADQARWEETMRTDLIRRKIPPDDFDRILAELTPGGGYAGIWPVRLRYINMRPEDRDKVPLKDLFRMEQREVKPPSTELTDTDKIRMFHLYDPDGFGYRTLAKEALKVGVEQAKEAKRKGRNPVYIHVTDGDSHSTQEDRQLLGELRATGAMVYCILIQQPSQAGTASGFIDDGREIISIREPRQLPDVIAEIQAECMERSLRGKMGLTA